MENKQLEELKRIELDLLKAFIDVCKKLNLQYFVAGGTAIGTIRHKGFIPWDDDIDLMMFRDEYNVFINNAQELLPPGYFLQTYSTDTGYMELFAKIRNSNTTFIEKQIQNIDMNHGVFIDIFPIDGYPSGCKGRHLLFRGKLTKLAVASNYFPKTFKRVVLGNLCKILLFSFNKKTLLRRFDKACSKFRAKDHYQSICYGGVWGKKEIFLTEHCGDGRIMRFEDVDVFVPQNIEDYLTMKYGDFMQLPPKEKQHSHHGTTVIDTEKPYTFYLSKKK